MEMPKWDATNAEALELAPCDNKDCWCNWKYWFSNIWTPLRPDKDGNLKPSRLTEHDHWKNTTTS